jgi:serine/threonine-protein kinase RsbW
MAFHTIDVRSEISALRQILSWLEDTCGNLLGVVELQQISIVVVEAFTNTVKYAHAGLPLDTPILLELHLQTHCVEVRIWDRGKPFDLQSYLENELENLTGEDSLHQEGQRGLLLMDRLTDNLYYEYYETKPDSHRQPCPGYQNCLVMRKKISSLNSP